jgi:hypothetical protein
MKSAGRLSIASAVGFEQAQRYRRQRARAGTSVGSSNRSKAIGTSTIAAKYGPPQDKRTRLSTSLVALVDCQRQRKGKGRANPHLTLYPDSAAMEFDQLP